LHEWKGRKVVVIGLARQGKVLTRYLAGQGAQVFVSDMKSETALEGALKEMKDLTVSYVLGEHPVSLLDGTEALFLSGGVPIDLKIVSEAVSRGIQLSNDSQMFIDLCPAPVIGITGSAGKSTTTELVGRMAKEAGKRNNSCAWVGGNIGRPLLQDVDRIRSEDWAVMELSSFQLELMVSSPHIAAVLNITPNHLDRHKTMQAYQEAKARILAFQAVDDIAVLNRDDVRSWGLKSEVKGRLLAFSLKDLGNEEGAFVASDQVWIRESGSEISICPLSVISLRGRHNLENVLAACAIAIAAGFPVEAMKEGLRGFTGIEHRLEFVRRIRGVDWYNDSIATSPQRAIAAMKSFDEPIVLLAGGRDKDLPWDEFARFVTDKVDHLILFGEARELIESAVRAAGIIDKPYSIQLVETLGQAVELASEVGEEGDVVLLAPGGTSFDQYIDFVERGDEFRSLVENIE